MYTHALMCTNARSSTILCSVVTMCTLLCSLADPSLTPENLSTVLDSMSDKQWEEFGGYANIPESELERIERQYSSEREKKQAVIHSLASTHPALSWTLVAHALYRTAWWGSDESCLRALDRLQQLFPIGMCIHFTCILCDHVHENQPYVSRINEIRAFIAQHIILAKFFFFTPEGSIMIVQF